MTDTTETPEVIDNPAALDKPAPITESRTAAVLAAQAEANAEQPTLVTPEPPVKFKGPKATVERIEAYLDGFGGPLSYELSQIRAIVNAGRGN